MFMHVPGVQPGHMPIAAERLPSAPTGEPSADQKTGLIGHSRVRE